MSTISDSLDQEFAPAWRPDPGDKLVGTITDLSEREGFDGSPYPIVTVRTDSGNELSLHAFHTVLQNELARIRPQVGTEIGIKYEGQKSTENSRARYHSYRVRATGSSGVNWSRYGDGAAATGEDHPIPPMPVAKPTVPTMQERAAERFGDDVPWDD